MSCPVYDKTEERGACGVGFAVHTKGLRSNKVLLDSKTMLERMEHRGACACDEDTGDGAGVMTGVPYELYAKFAKQANVELPPMGHFATGMIFVDPLTCNERTFIGKLTPIVAECGLKILFHRVADVDRKVIGIVAKRQEPVIYQLFIVDKKKPEKFDGKEFRTRVFLLRKYASHQLGNLCYICSLSVDIVIYKGMFSTEQLWNYYADLKSPDYCTHFAMVHNRFSTNTLPSWSRAHPQRVIAHNGEINTLRGNVNFALSRQSVMRSNRFSTDLVTKLFPIVEADMSDSGSLDNQVEFLSQVGDYSLPEAIMMVIPEVWHSLDPAKGDIPQHKWNFYKWAANCFEPWDGPALVVFADGRYVGAVLDRNGLRPARFYSTSDDMVYLASEVGVVDINPLTTIVQKGRLKAGRLVIVDVEEGRLLDDEALKASIATRFPYGQWLEQGALHIDQFMSADRPLPSTNSNEALQMHVYASGGDQVRPAAGLFTDRRLPMFGFTPENISLLLLPMLSTKKEALGSMGNDAALACLSERSPLVFDYFQQLFAQVTNPPIDPFREKIVMTLSYPIGPQSNVLLPSAEQTHRLWLDNPVLSLKQTIFLRSLNGKTSSPSSSSGPLPNSNSSVWKWRSCILDCTFPAQSSTDSLGDDLEHALDHLCLAAEQAVRSGDSQLIILSDRRASPFRVPIPSLLSLGAVHQHLLSKKLRMNIGLIVESGEVKEVHHFCTLIGFGADAICPYLILEAVHQLDRDGALGKVGSDEQAVYEQFKGAIERGIFKVIAKMGISTLHSYKGAQIFEAVGLAQSVIDKCFRKCKSRIGGADFACLAYEACMRHQLSYPKIQEDDVDEEEVKASWAVDLFSEFASNHGVYHWRKGGERHMNDPDTVAALQAAAKSNSSDAYRKFTEVAESSSRWCTLRGQLELVYADQPIPIEKVESASEIVKRFATGAMSLGSISSEAHTSLAIAMNKMGAMSNTGEGGETPERYLDPRIRSSIKQVASARFGVNSSYLAHADMLQIKMAQGAKPGEGGELPGYKVTAEIAKTRHSVAGVGLISPPPHHDIYSIEDLAQLIYDLGAANPLATISVKLVSEVGVGVIASGVAKARAAHITVSGHDGGTGASSWTGIKHAGLPWELGIAETHQCLVHQHMRSRVTLQADGQIRTGRDVVVAALLGADEFAMSTAPLIVLGCTMMRKCHLNTCPVGIATQDPVLRAKFAGHPEHVVNYFFAMAEEIRDHMSRLGVATFDELIGRTEMLRPAKSLASWKSKALNLSGLFEKPESFMISHDLLNRPSFDASHVPPAFHSSTTGSLASGLPSDRRLDIAMLMAARQLIDDPQTVDCSVLRLEDMEISNEDRTVGATISYAISAKYSEAGLPEGQRIEVNFRGSAGQSFGAFLVNGIFFNLVGDANDYVAKGLSGGQIVVAPPATLLASGFKSEENIIIGNACLYGATAGRLFLRGQAAERFCVRNSGATVVAEGVGDHGCEYMTGGRAVILGRVGRNFAAGMSGGLAFCYEPCFKAEIGLRRRFNTDLVDLVLMKPDNEYAGWLKATLQDFTQATGSEIGSTILASWNQLLGNFVLIYPRDYRAAIEAEAAAAKASKEVGAKPPPPVVADRPVTVDTKNEQGDQLNGKSPSPPVVDLEDIATNGSAEPLDKLRGFVKYNRDKQAYRPVEDRVQDWGEVYDHAHVRKGLKRQAARCMDCGVPFCQSKTGCPLGNLIPNWNELVFKNDWESAHKALAQTNNFPEFTGRVCPAPCEGACVLGINADAVAIKSIECAIADKAWEQGWLKPREDIALPTGRRVAIIGSGPAGLACADQLCKAGHEVTVIERRNKVGGLLRYGIPSMKLSRDVLDRRIDHMHANGVTFQVNCSVGTAEVVKDGRYDLNGCLHNPSEEHRTRSARSLVEEFAAVVTCIGSTWPRDLTIPGRNLDGIHFAMTFLETWQRTQKSGSNSAQPVLPDYKPNPTALAAGKRVVVLGGGDTGVDCMATSLRQGATNVRSLEILPPPPESRRNDNPWPQWPTVWRVDYGHAEVALKYGRDPRSFNILSKEFIDNGSGSVAGLRTVKIEWVKDDKTGRWQMSEVPNSEEIIECDLVLLAMGFVGPENSLIHELSLATNANSTIKAATEEDFDQPSYLNQPSSRPPYHTSFARVYAAGDCRRGQSLVVHAINEGRQVARQVDLDLMGSSSLPGPGGIVALAATNYGDQQRPILKAEA